MDKSEFWIQNAVYFLWGTLIVVLILILNRYAKARAKARAAKLNPQVRLYAFELTKAKGEITFFFEADDVLDYEFFIEQAEKKTRTIIYSGQCKAGGQKVKFDTTKIANGNYYYGIQTAFQRSEKLVVIEN